VLGRAGARDPMQMADGWSIPDCCNCQLSCHHRATFFHCVHSICCNCQLSSPNEKRARVQVDAMAPRVRVPCKAQVTLNWWGGSMSGCSPLKMPHRGNPQLQNPRGFVAEPDVSISARWRYMRAGRWEFRAGWAFVCFRQGKSCVQVDGTRVRVQVQPAPACHDAVRPRLPCRFPCCLGCPRCWSRVCFCGATRARPAGLIRTGRKAE
jgi:hypothetical protein